MAVGSDRGQETGDRGQETLIFDASFVCNFVAFVESNREVHAKARSRGELEPLKTNAEIAKRSYAGATAW